MRIGAAKIPSNSPGRNRGGADGAAGAAGAGGTPRLSILLKKPPLQLQSVDHAESCHRL